MTLEPKPGVIDDEIDDAPQIAQTVFDDEVWETYARLLEKHGPHDLASSHVEIRQLLERANVQSS